MEKKGIIFVYPMTTNVVKQSRKVCSSFQPPGPPRGRKSSSHELYFIHSPVPGRTSANFSQVMNFLGVEKHNQHHSEAFLPLCGFLS